MITLKLKVVSISCLICGKDKLCILKLMGKLYGWIIMTGQVSNIFCIIFIDYLDETDFDCQ